MNSGRMITMATNKLEVQYFTRTGVLKFDTAYYTTGGSTDPASAIKAQVAALPFPDYAAGTVQSIVFNMSVSLLPSNLNPYRDTLTNTFLYRITISEDGNPQHVIYAIEQATGSSTADVG